MQLKKIYANKETFREIDFKENSINIILGTKSKDNTENQGKKKTAQTVNGVGKSLSIDIINYCLGANKDKESILSRLIDWEFCLDVCIDGKDHKIRRSLEKITLDGKKKSLTDLTLFFESELFPLATDYKYISYRNLICRYLRVPPKTYQEWQTCKKNEDIDKSYLFTAFLLDLDIDLIINNIAIKDEINQLDKTNRFFNKEGSDIFPHGKNANMRINSIEADISKLEGKLRDFKIAEAYNDIKRDIEVINAKKNDVINQIVKNENVLSAINKSIDQKIEITAKHVFDIYEEMQTIFPDNVKTSIEDVSKFHEMIIESRRFRLTKDKQSVLNDINGLNDQLKLLDDEINSKMKYLSDKVSLNEYEKMNKQLADYKIELDRMMQYNNLIKKIKENVAGLKKQLADDTVKAYQYVKISQGYMQQISNNFKSFVDTIYNESKYSGVEFDVNDGDNKIRYDFNVKVESDKSGGINKVKIFCMDMILWLSRNRSNVEFMYHDSLIFSEVDPRQVYEMLKIAKRICEQNNFQYICNMNYDTFSEVSQIAEEYKDDIFLNELNNAVRLKLLDHHVSQKLLGVQVD